MLQCKTVIKEFYHRQCSRLNTLDRAASKQQDSSIYGNRRRLTLYSNNSNKSSKWHMLLLNYVIFKWI